MTNNSGTVGELRSLLGAKVLVDDGSRQQRSHDFWLLDFQRRLHGAKAPLPLCVVRPESEEDVAALLRFAGSRGLAVVPYGLGSGVCGGARGHEGAIALDMSAMDQLIEINDTALTVTVQAGMRGSDLEQRLNDAGYSMGHFPQSMRLSSVGGWVATRASGQFSTKYGSIEDMLVCARGFLADGTPIATGNTPRASAGPNLNQLLLGSEGTLAVLTTLTFKIHPRPQKQCMSAFEFTSFSNGLEAIRHMLRDGWRPALVRLYDASETHRHFASFTRRRQCLLLLLSEGPSRLADLEIEECSRMATMHGGASLGAAPVKHWLERRYEIADVNDLATRKGVVFDTIEVAANWDRIGALYNEAIAALRRVPGIIAASAHSSHSYQQGTCLYFTFAVKKPHWVRKQALRLLGARQVFTSPEDLSAVESSYLECWQAVMQAAIANGGTISHHHGIGKVRLPWLEAELGTGLQVLRAIKKGLDPAGTLNPGTLLDERGTGTERSSYG